MRKFNAVLSIVILALFLLHAVMGGFQLIGWINGGSDIMQAGAWVMLAATAVHIIIGTVLTADTLKAQKKAGASYFRENKLFWLRRMSGFAVMLFLIFHLMIFIGKNNGAYRLELFEIPQLTASVLLVLSLIIHVVSNIRPLMLALGARGFGEFLADAAFVLSALLLFTGAAFVVYYIRWNFF